jgi:hypothetical protein
MGNPLPPRTVARSVKDHPSAGAFRFS